MKSLLVLGATLLALLSFSLFSSCNRPAQPFVNTTGAVAFPVDGLVQAEQLSKRENKPIFLFAHAGYCSACKAMKKDVLPVKEVGNVFNQKFVNAQVDIESAEGKELVKKYNIDATPTLLFLNTDGVVIKRASGFHSKEELIALAAGL